MNEPQNPWEARYQAGTTGWDRGAVSPQLQRWLASGELRPCRIFVPGCGNGYEAVALAAAGFEVVALDIAPTPVRELKAQLAAAGLSAEVVQGDLLQWQPEAPFDAIYEQTSLCALSPDDWPRYEEQLHHWLRPGGQLFSLFMQTNKAGGPPFHCDPVEMEALLPPDRWQWPAEDRYQKVPHPAGFHELAMVLGRL